LISGKTSSCLLVVITKGIRRGRLSPPLTGLKKLALTFGTLLSSQGAIAHLRLGFCFGSGATPLT
jgi:hypothetical protein